MKELQTLIKMHQRELDELRRALVSLENQKEQLVSMAVKLQEELNAEWEAAQGQPQMASYMAGYEKRVKKRQMDIALEVGRLEGEMEKRRQLIAESFGELKKYEIALDQRLEALAASEKAKEQAALDEAAIQGFTRKKDD